MRTNNRWVIAIAGVFFQIALGAVYAWSVFRVPLTKQFGWSISQVTLTFTISIFVLGFAAFFGGLWLNRKGPRIVALTGGVFYGVGVFLASFTHSLAWLYISYGLIGGIGLGLGYIVPVAVLVKWFPDKRGLITGIAVGGFGAGALITAPVATRLIQSVGVLSTFAYLGIGYFIITIIAGMFMQNPPEGWQLEGWKPSALQTSQRAGHDFVLSEALKTWQWWALWLLLFLILRRHFGHLAGGADFSGIDQSKCGGRGQHGRNRQPWKRSRSRLLGVGIGSDHAPLHILVMFIVQVLLFWFFPTITTASLMTIVTFIVLMCYGGGFGTMPAFTADYFGPKNVGPIYGLMLTAWSFASAVGPLFIAHMRETTGSYAGALHVIAVVMAISILLPVLVRPPRASVQLAARRKRNSPKAKTIAII